MPIFPSAKSMSFYQPREKKGKWTIIDDYIIEIESFFEKPEKFKIGYLDRTELQLKFLK